VSVRDLPFCDPRFVMEFMDGFAAREAERRRIEKARPAHTLGHELAEKAGIE
jgi:hypothetical protein